MRLPDLAAELVRFEVDVLSREECHPEHTHCHGVFADPVAAGLVASLARPGGNITGLSWGAIELSSKQLELLKATVPRLSTLAVLTRPSQFHRQVVKDVETRPYIGATPSDPGGARTRRVRHCLLDDEEIACRRGPHPGGSDVQSSPNAARGACGREPSARDVWAAGQCREAPGV